ncbi:ArsR family transcriptional regulator [Veillonella sp.]|uniref:ArsR/SmtB family transcription factor n=1 Tax=unclassified Veillonella TaxID=2630086 RepID=UPI00344D0F3C
MGSIQDKLGISQSAVSHYLDLMQRAGLLESARYGKWTYYRRNEATIVALATYIEQEL